MHTALIAAGVSAGLVGAGAAVSTSTAPGTTVIRSNVTCAAGSNSYPAAGGGATCLSEYTPYVQSGASSVVVATNGPRVLVRKG